MTEQVCVYKRHIGKRRDAPYTRFMVDLEEFDAEIADAEKEEREPIYVLDTTEDAPSFDGLSKAEQKKVVAAQADRVKLKEIRDAEANE